ncbi:hypothetical protein [Pseudomonas sp. R16(2017)]|uniref:hypothetical protein n=1 Tax=Pseudomonas sp. R16(2017) TaxID=1981704 RepID=UPI00111C0570|nr:hypothetical protein [Pseudomonas sp. R16(2017)]
MQAKHTPGPWGYWSGYNYADQIEAQVTADGGDIVIASYNHLIPEGEANAKLIAAAPDLLSLAMRWLALDGEWHPDRFENEKAQLLIETKDLISKATA